MVIEFHDWGVVKIPQFFQCGQLPFSYHLLRNLSSVRLKFRSMIHRKYVYFINSQIPTKLRNECEDIAKKGLKVKVKAKAKLLINYLDFAFFSILQGGHLKLGIHFFQSWIFFSFVLRGRLLFIVMKKDWVFTIMISFHS